MIKNKIILNILGNISNNYYNIKYYNHTNFEYTVNNYN